jgi:hypothetical protein
VRSAAIIRRPVIAQPSEAQIGGFLFLCGERVRGVIRGTHAGCRFDRHMMFVGLGWL